METRVITIRAMGIRIRPIRIKAMTRAMGTRLTWIPVRLPYALTATTLITLTLARPMGTTDLAGFRAESLSASGRGVGAGATSTAGVGTMADAAIMVDVDTAEAATTGAARPLPRAEDFAETATAEADVPSLAPDAASVAVAVASVDVPSVAALDVPSEAADVASAVVAVPLAEADVASEAVAIPLVVADTVGAVMVVGIGRFRY